MGTVQFRTECHNVNLLVEQMLNCGFAYLNRQLVITATADYSWLACRAERSGRDLRCSKKSERHMIDWLQSLGLKLLIARRDRVNCNAITF